MMFHSIFLLHCAEMWNLKSRCYKSSSIVITFFLEPPWVPVGGSCQNRLMIISGRLEDKAWGAFYKGDVCFLKYQRRVEIIFMGVGTFVFHPCWLPSATLVSLFFEVFSLPQGAPKYAPVKSHDWLFIVLWLCFICLYCRPK